MRQDKPLDLVQLSPVEPVIGRELDRFQQNLASSPEALAWIWAGSCPSLL